MAIKIRIPLLPGIQNERQRREMEQSDTIQDYQADAVEGVSDLGTDQYDSLVFFAKTYEDIAGNQITLPKLVFNTFEVSCPSTKAIIRTQLTGGTVTELISDSDYDITLTITVASAFDNLRPDTGINALIAAYKAQTTIPLYCKKLNAYGITEVVITGIDEIDDSYSFKTFTITAVNEIDDILRLEQENIS